MGHPVYTNISLKLCNSTQQARVTPLVSCLCDSLWGNWNTLKITKMIRESSLSSPILNMKCILEVLSKTIFRLNFKQTAPPRALSPKLENNVYLRNAKCFLWWLYTIDSRLWKFKPHFTLSQYIIQLTDYTDNILYNSQITLIIYYTTHRLHW